MNIHMKIMLSVVAGATVTALTVGAIVAFNINSTVAVAAVVSASSAAVVVISQFVASDIAKPLNAAADMIREMNRGYLSARLNLKRYDEIGLLANRLDKLADNLLTNAVGPVTTDSADEARPSACGETQTVSSQYGRRNQPTTAQQKWYAALPNRNAYMATMLAFKGTVPTMSKDDVLTIDDCEMWR